MARYDDGSGHCLTPTDIWQDAANRAIGSLSVLDDTQKRAISSISYETMEMYMDQLKQQHSLRRRSRLCAKLEPLMRQLRTFSAAIGLFTQSNPEIS